MAVKVDRRNIDKFARELEAFDRRVAQRAGAETLNSVAAGAARLAKRRIRRTMVLRNKWTLGSIKSTRTPASRRLDRQFTLVGSQQDYMGLQESGGGIPLNNGGKRITTAQGAREGDTSFPRKKAARGGLRVKNMKLAPTRRFAGKRSKRIKAFLNVTLARQEGYRFVYLELPRNRQGIFDVKQRRIKMVHAIVRRKLRVKPRPWLEPSADTARRAAPSVYAREVGKAIASSGMFD